MPADPRLQPFYEQTLRWESCGGEFQCATLRVPLTYDDPGGESLSISVLRARSTGQRRGSLIVNPGGPGGSGVDYARAARAIVSESILDAYDVVGFDPRGVGESEPVRCLTGRQTDEFLAADGTPDDDAEIDELTRLTRDFGAACERRAPDLVTRVSTIEVAKDMDVLRAALGDDKLTFLGKSYGTFLGATYAELFPQRVGRLVLDGAVDPAADSAGYAVGQARGFQRAYERFLADCLTQDDCPFRGLSVPQAVTKTVELLRQVDGAPVPTNDARRPLTEAMVTSCIAFSLYDNESSWPTLRLALQEVLDGRGDTCLSLQDLFLDRDESGRYRTNGFDALYVVSALDRPTVADLATTRRLADAWAADVSSVFGAGFAWGNLALAQWPVGGVNRPHRVVAPGTPPILVVGTTYDPATPVEWARSLAGQLDRGVLLEWDGDGHTAYRRGSTCIDEAVDAYLLDGTTPVSGSTCR